MNEDLIKPDTNKPVVPDMDSDTPSITPEIEDIPVPKPPELTKEVAPPLASSPSSDPVQPTMSEAPKPPTSAVAPKSPKPWLRIVLIVVVVLLLVTTIVYAAFAVGFSRGHTAGRKDQVAASEATALKIPEHATMVAQCAVGEGTQYVLPSDIPQGPIYNIWNSKVTGIEFMLAESKIAANKTLDLALKNQKYDHIDVMYEAAGHAGFTEPHYHIVLSMIPYADEQKITCDSNNSSSSGTSSHDSHDMSSMGM